MTARLATALSRGHHGAARNLLLAAAMAAGLDDRIVDRVADEALRRLSEAHRRGLRLIEFADDDALPGSVRDAAAVMRLARDEFGGWFPTRPG